VNPGYPRVGPDWLALREPADAAARASDLADLVARTVRGSTAVTIHDLGAGTGSMLRWLAPRLPGPQRWVLYDRDPDLLALAAGGPPGTAAADGTPVTVATRTGDITRLDAADLAGTGGPDGRHATLVTASALLDMLTRDEIERIVATCVAADCPTLLTITVIGRVELTPIDPLDAIVTEAFNAHQRRTVAGRSLLGPDAVDATIAAFDRYGVQVQVRESPWRLGAGQAALTAEWLRGWLDAACEQDPELAGPVAAYTRRRRAQAQSGRLDVVVHHRDLLAGRE
jgi:hypothetical protein